MDSNCSIRFGFRISNSNLYKFINKHSNVREKFQRCRMSFDKSICDIESALSHIRYIPFIHSFILELIEYKSIRIILLFVYARKNYACFERSACEFNKWNEILHKYSNGMPAIRRNRRNGLLRFNTNFCRLVFLYASRKENSRMVPWFFTSWRFCFNGRLYLFVVLFGACATIGILCKVKILL